MARNGQGVVLERTHTGHSLVREHLAHAADLVLRRNDERDHRRAVALGQLQARPNITKHDRARDRAPPRLPPPSPPPGTPRTPTRQQHQHRHRAASPHRKQRHRACEAGGRGGLLSTFARTRMATTGHQHPLQAPARPGPDRSTTQTLPGNPPPSNGFSLMRAHTRVALGS